MSAIWKAHQILVGRRQKKLSPGGNVEKRRRLASSLDVVGSETIIFSANSLIKNGSTRVLPTYSQNDPGAPEIVKLPIDAREAEEHGYQATDAVDDFIEEKSPNQIEVSELKVAEHVPPQEVEVEAGVGGDWDYLDNRNYLSEQFTQQEKNSRVEWRAGISALQRKTKNLLAQVVSKISNNTDFAPKIHKTRLKTTKNKLLNLLLSLIMAGSLLVGLIVFVPAVYYLVFPADIIKISPREEGSPLGGLFDSNAIGPGTNPENPDSQLKDQSNQTQESTFYTPPRDETLPDGDWLIIPRIGVRTPLRKTADPKEALDKGVWQAPDFGIPGDRTQPMILAAHRFGWKWWWQDDYWKYNSFYNLPETEPGDIVEVISDKRKWLYEIYAGEEGDEITDYAADLILYTCKYLQSPIRYFRYARIIDPTAMTQ